MTTQQKLAFETQETSPSTLNFTLASKVKSLHKNWCENSPAKEQTYRGRLNQLIALSQEFSMPLSEIDIPLIKRKIDEWLEQGYAWKTGHTRLCLLRKVFYWFDVPLNDNPAHAVLLDLFYSSSRFSDSDPFRFGIRKGTYQISTKHKRHKPAQKEAPQAKPKETPKETPQAKPKKLEACKGLYQATALGDVDYKTSPQEFCELWLNMGIHLHQELQKLDKFPAVVIIRKVG